MEETLHTHFMNDGYPPRNRMLRDLSLDVVPNGKGGATIQAPVVPEICSKAGIRIIDSSAGRLMLQMADYVRNSLGSLQGGMTALEGTWPVSMLPGKPPEDRGKRVIWWFIICHRGQQAPFKPGQMCYMWRVLRS